MAGDDPRSSLPARYGAFYSRVGLAIAWTSTNVGPGAKACTESGPRAWKHAKPLSPEPGTAAGFFAARCETRNPVIPAVANRLFLFDFDGAPFEELVAKYELVLPGGAWRVATARGTHLYGSAPPGHPGLKVELTPERVTTISDGYTLAAPGRHPSGLQYELANVDIDNGGERPPAVDAVLLARLQELASGGRERVADLIDSGDPISVGDRHAALMHRAARLRGEGLGARAIRADLEELAERFTGPTGRRGEIDGVVKWVMGKEAPPPIDKVDVELLGLLDKLPGAPPPNREERRRTAKRVRKVLERPISQVAAKQVEWLIPLLVPRRTITLVCGIGGLGKSGLLLAWAALVTRAGESVLIISYEDAAEEVIRPRFEALGGDLELLRELYVDPLDGSISFPVDLPDLEQIVSRRRSRLVLIDPVSASLDAKLDSHRDKDVRVVLGQLAKLAERHGLAVVLNAHLNKGPTNDPYLRINGSTAFYNAARSVLTVTVDPEDSDTHRFVTHHKSNYGQLAPVQRWRVEVVEVPSPSGPIETARMVFVEDALDVRREDVLGSYERDDKRGEAATLLLAELAGGRRPSADVKAAGMKQGISPRTMQRAAQDLEVVIEDETTESGRVTYWGFEGSRHTPSHTVGATPSEPHNQAETGGSRQVADMGGGATPDGPTGPCAHERQWLARDKVWRCVECEPPAFPGEIVEERNR